MADSESVESPERGSPSGLKGRLSDIYFPALLEPAVDALVQRLGAKATVDDPVHGRASDIAPISALLAKAAASLAQHKARYERTAFVTGIDRDVTEGVLAVTLASKNIDMPVAVVAERRREREVELRVYAATELVTGKSAARAALVPAEEDAPLPQVVAEHWDALQRGDLPAALAAFEEEGALRDARGVEHAKSADLKASFEKLIAGGILRRGGIADDGRICAIEYTRMRDSGASAGLIVYERGDSGLLRVARLYEDIAL